MAPECKRGGAGGTKIDAGVADVGRVVARQRGYFASGATRPAEARLAALARLDEGLAAREEELLAALAADLGKPPVEAWLAELHFLRAEIRHVTGRLRGWMRPRRAGHPLFLLPARSEVRREPFGVALVIAPWNYPVQLALSPVIAAVAAGNCAVIKPSELAPASSAVLASLVAEVFDPGHVSVVEGGPETGEALLGGEFDMFFCTGSGRVGRLVAAAAARRMVPAVLELGGKCPAVIGPDIDCGQTVERIVAGKFFNAGQTCMAPDFVAVPEAQRAEFIGRAAEFIGRCYGRGRSSDLARVVNRRHFQRIEALATGEVTRIGEDDAEACLMAPRIVAAGWDHPAMQEEVFGPLLPVVGYGGGGELLERLGALPGVLALYVFSRDRGFQERVAGAVRSGSVCFNDVMKQGINADLPFGGVGESGHGRYRGRAGFESFSYARSVTRRYFAPDPFFSPPPYGRLLERLRRWLG